MSAGNSLPSFDGKPLIKPKAKSANRHSRETAVKAVEGTGLSVTQYRRGKFILKYGSPEIQQLVRENKLSIWRAYNYVKHEQDVKVFQWVSKNLPSSDGKRDQP